FAAVPTRILPPIPGATPLLCALLLLIVLLVIATLPALAATPPPRPVLELDWHNCDIGRPATLPLMVLLVITIVPPVNSTPPPVPPLHVRLPAAARLLLIVTPFSVTVPLLNRPPPCRPGLPRFGMVLLSLIVESISVPPPISRTAG